MALFKVSTSALSLQMLMFRAGRGEGDGHVVLRDQRPHLLRRQRGVRERDPRGALLAADPEVLDDQPAESAESSAPGDTAVSRN